MGQSARPVGRPQSFTENDALDAAIAIIDSGGLASCTLRAVADWVDVTPMALYRSFRSKSDLLDRIPDHLLLSVVTKWDETTPSESGLQMLRHLALEVTTILSTNPSVVPLFLQPTMGPNMKGLVDHAVRGMVEDGFRAERAAGLLRATMALVVGLAASGGESAEANVGPIVEDALDVWFEGIAASG